MTATATRGPLGAAGPGELLATLQDAVDAVCALSLPGTTSGGREGWGEVVRACQQLVNSATAVQDEAIVRLCAIEPDVLEDGTLVERPRAPGHVSLDGPSLVSGALDVSAVHAERRVRGAVRLAADGAPGTTTCTGLGGLHDAMRTGRLDAYRASVVADELEEAPPEVAETVVATLGEHLARDTAPQLRRRCRRLLARISPDLLRQRARRAREACGLRRWVDEPGVDRWEGTFPSEDAARAWAAIDARAQQLVADGTCERVERARAQALVDLVTASATITTVVMLAVPADEATRGCSDSAAALPAAARPGTGASTPRSGPDRRRVEAVGADLVEVPNPLGGEPVLVSGAWVDRLLDTATTTVRPVPCHPATGAMRSDVTTTSYRPPDELAALVRRRDGRCRFPGCSVAARFCDLDHVRPWPAGPTRDDNLACLCRRHHRVKQRPGWRAALATDGTLTWTDPTGRVRTTLPVDALHRVVLPEPAAATVDATAPSPTTAPLTPVPDARDGAAPGTTDAHSGLEFALEHLLGPVGTPGGAPGERRAARTYRRTLQVVDDHAVTLTVASATRACRRTHRRGRIPPDDPDIPPF